MNLSPKWADLLVSAGFEAEHWSAIGAADAPDRAIMSFASEHGFVVLTHDLDFGTILAASGDNKPSVVQLRADDTRPERIGAQVIAALRVMDADLAAGALLTIDPARTRMRLLPLRPAG